MSLKDYWYIACESKLLAQRPVSAQIFDQPIALWRSADGQPNAVIDRCAHRNAPLSEGSVANGCLVCPYHSWHYNGSGDCTHIPSLSEGRPIHSGAKIRSWPCCEQDGYVFVWPGDERPSGKPRPFPHCNEKGWTTFRMKTRFASSVEACLENFLDCPHTSSVHRGWFRSPDPREIEAEIRRDSDGVTVEFKDEPTTKSLVTRLFYPKGQTPRHLDRFLMPNISRVDYEFDSKHHFIITSSATPISELDTDVYTVITFRYGRIAPLVRLVFEPMSRHIIGQDVDILAKQGANLRRFDQPDYTHIETDLISLHMQALRRQAERRERPTREYPNQSVRIRF